MLFEMTMFWLLASSSLLGRALGSCECGYSITGSNEDAYIFTDLFESDFVHIDVADKGGYGQHGWAVQEFDMPSDVARGPFGESFRSGNALASTLRDGKVFEGVGSRGGDAGLQLVVAGDVEDGMVAGAQLATTELHYHHGTFRVGMKVTDVAGTCSAFFWYQNDTQEIDIEFLSSQFHRDKGTFPVNLVLQSKDETARAEDFKTVPLPFDPTADFHEYRFDFLEDRVIFYADGSVLAQMSGSGVPASAGHLLISHWSNGNPGWSAGPPDTEATTTFSYVKAYFNSSLESRGEDYQTRCARGRGRQERAICAVPDYDKTFFFRYQDGTATDQTTDGEHENEGDKPVPAPAPWWLFMSAMVLTWGTWLLVRGVW
ncbi:glycoside hydrolase family 16 protein [Xylariomycetidae sp. FL2044]|nr:glycoside hydrolase family 16 protein [Xylariomycetidae sp. FL2044]